MKRKKRNGGRRYNLTTFIKESLGDNPRAIGRLFEWILNLALVGNSPIWKAARTDGKRKNGTKRTLDQPSDL